MASPMNAAQQNLPFPSNRTLPSKANAIGPKSGMNEINLL